MYIEDMSKQLMIIHPKFVVVFQTLLILDTAHTLGKLYILFFFTVVFLRHLPVSLTLAL